MRVRKRPIEIEVERFDPDVRPWPAGVTGLVFFRPCSNCGGETGHEPRHGNIETMEGFGVACPGDWIATGVQGEKYPIKPSILAATYDTVPEDGEKPGPLDDLLATAWGIIANAHRGDWEKAHPAWKAAASRWRDRYFAWIDRGAPVRALDTPGPATYTGGEGGNAPT